MGGVDGGLRRALGLVEVGPRRDQGDATVDARLVQDLDVDPTGRVLQLAALALGQAAPYAEAFSVVEGILQALGGDLAASADRLGDTNRSTLLREEDLGVDLGAQRVVHPEDGDLVGSRGHRVLRLCAACLAAWCSRPLASGAPVSELQRPQAGRMLSRR